MRFLFLLQVLRRLQVQRGHGRYLLSLITVKRKLVIEVSLLYCSSQTHCSFFCCCAVWYSLTKRMSDTTKLLLYILRTYCATYCFIVTQSLFFLLPFRDFLKNNPLKKPNKVCKSRRERRHRQLIHLHDTQNSQAFFRVFKKLSPGYLVVITSCNTHVY